MKQLLVSVSTLSDLAILLSACNTMPDKPDFKVSTAHDGKYKGERIDISGGSIGSLGWRLIERLEVTGLLETRFVKVRGLLIVIEIESLIPNTAHYW